MSITIKSRYGDKTLYVAERASDVRTALVEAVRNRADLSGADLRSADLSGADLRSADLRSADLSGADLSGADLRSANLSGADLRSADGFNPRQHNDLLILLDQPGKIRAYKLVTANGAGPTYGGLVYEIGQTVEVPGADTDANRDCAAGVNLATLPWCVRNWRDGYRILIAEFTAKDIAAIPLSDGKFRVRKAKVVGEVDLVDLGLVPELEDVASEEAA